MVCKSCINAHVTKCSQGQPRGQKLIPFERFALSLHVWASQMFIDNNLSGPLCCVGKCGSERWSKVDFESMATGTEEQFEMGDPENLPGADHHHLQRGGVSADRQEGQWDRAGGAPCGREHDQGGLWPAHTHCGKPAGRRDIQGFWKFSQPANYNE